MNILRRRHRFVPLVWCKIIKKEWEVLFLYTIHKKVTSDKGHLYSLIKAYIFILLLT